MPAFTTDPILDLVAFFLVGATSILALKTWQLRAATVALANDTVQATKVSDRHQQETLSQICVIDQFGGTGTSTWRIDLGGRRDLMNLELCQPQARLLGANENGESSAAVPA
jgi:hypothetical protein